MAQSFHNPLFIDGHTRTAIVTYERDWPKFTITSVTINPTHALPPEDVEVLSRLEPETVEKFERIAMLDTIRKAEFRAKDLAKYARHDALCSTVVNPETGCDCGLARLLPATA